jgi:N-acyl homoserine lactone hydrolase
MKPIMAEDDHLLTSPNCVGLMPNDITHVVCSHFHTDHCGCENMSPANDTTN